ncbi:MAG TPA: hypothetical protein VII95_05425 [Terriglobales bacterium]
MARFWTDSVVLCYSNVEEAKQWWIKTFDCGEANAREDDPLPSDVALKLPGDAEPSIWLSDRAEVLQAGLQRSDEHPIIFCSKLQKAHEYLLGIGAAPGLIQDGGDTQFFEIRDSEGNVIEICKEP